MDFNRSPRWKTGFVKRFWWNQIVCGKNWNEPSPAGQKTDFWFCPSIWFCAEIYEKMRAKPRRRRGERANKLPAKFAMFRLVAITERSANLFWARISALTGRNPPQRLAAWRRTKPAKIETFFRGRAQKILSIKESIFAGFVSLLTQGRAASHPSRAFGGQSRRAKKRGYGERNFCPPAGNPQRIFRVAVPKEKE